MERNHVKDMAAIATALDGKVKFSRISANQILPGAPGVSINSLHCVGKRFGLYFYTSREAVDGVFHCKGAVMPTYVVLEGSDVVYEIMG